MPKRSQASLSYLQGDHLSMYCIHLSESTDVPVRSPKNRGCTRHDTSLVGVGLHSNPSGMFEAEQMIYHLESFGPFRVVDSTYIDHAFELALRVVAEESKDWDDGRRRNVERQFVFED